MGLLQPDVRHGGRHRESRLSRARKAITVYSLRQARAAAAASQETGRPVLLLSAPDAAASGGPAWFAVLAAMAAADFPAATLEAVLDCGAMPGHALAALRQGFASIRYDGPSFDAVADMARQRGAKLLRRRPESLDLRDHPAADDEAALAAACRRWLQVTE